MTAKTERTLRLESYSRAPHQLSYVFSLDGARYHTAVWYDTVDLTALEATHGVEKMEWIYAHIGLFEINKVCSLVPDVLDLGPFARWHTEALEALWRTIFVNVWAQWRFENNLPDYKGPRFASPPTGTAPALLTPPANASPRYLAACGGGKDSLVSARLLDRAGVSYESIGYSHSIYGAAQPQHTLIERLLKHTGATSHNRIWMFDDFLDAPVLTLAPAPGVHTLCAAETPASVFATLPLLLARGLDALVLGHEKSADVGNMVWRGEEVNHQWGKSTDAEVRLTGYINAHIMPGTIFFSVLKPIHDYVIFELLRQDQDAVYATHSCNTVKPWCQRCAKCAYVWLSYVAHLEPEVVAPNFNGDLTTVPRNREWFQQMLGLDEHTPFECVGQVEEARLALRMSLTQGRLTSAEAREWRERSAARLLGGAASERAEVEKALTDFSRVDESYHRIPAHMREAIFTQLLAAGKRAHERGSKILLS